MSVLETHGQPSSLQLTPKGDLILVKVADAEDKTTAGLLLPGTAQQKPTSGDAVLLKAECGMQRSTLKGC